MSGHGLEEEIVRKYREIPMTSLSGLRKKFLHFLEIFFGVDG